MTKPRYPKGCPAGSQARGGASSPSDYAWYVNFNNGNVNYNNQDNSGFVRAVRRVPAGECQGEAVSFRELYQAWLQTRRGKRPSLNQLAFGTRWAERLLRRQEQLNAGTWSPAPPTCFIARRPKAREIHAPDFGDRVVHHWLVPQLEALWEPRFIHDSFSNRPGKGTHAAVDRLQAFVRQVHSGQGDGWYLQLDIHNFFNSIHRPTLYRALKRVLQAGGARPAVRHAVHALLRHPPLAAGVRHCSTPAERALVPPHKRLENAASGCGLPIGNLSSQFFANVYLDALDQFVKHELKVRRYLRYVDDFVLVHHSREQLLEWKARIERFLAERLRLRLKAEVKLKPLEAGCDFLGYIVYPTHRLVRRRVLHHAREALQAWERRHVRGRVIRATPEAFREARSCWSSYQGHLNHCSAWRARGRLQRDFPWLPAVTRRRRFHWRLEGQTVTVQLYPS